MTTPDDFVGPGRYSTHTRLSTFADATRKCPACLVSRDDSGYLCRSCYTQAASDLKGDFKDFVSFTRWVNFKYQNIHSLYTIHKWLGKV